MRTGQEQLDQYKEWHKSRENFQSKVCKMAAELKAKKEGEKK